ncbi:hypothetical protein ACIBKY_49740 [Nonomuraea sp. NPDC050394]|uniref:hypothetical protein n=1 Tax=Nonomuraea sp. NPDC050394 TaxID=3364363 RepID=UPI00378CF0A9
MLTRKTLIAAIVLIAAIASIAFVIWQSNKAGPLAWPCEKNCDRASGRVTATLERGERLDWAHIFLTNRSEKTAQIEAIRLLAESARITEARVAGPGRTLGGGILRADSDVTDWGVQLLPAYKATVPPVTSDPQHRGVVLVLTVTSMSDSIAEINGVEVTYRTGGTVYTDRFLSELIICPRSQLKAPECR